MLVTRLKSVVFLQPLGALNHATALTTMPSGEVLTARNIGQKRQVGQRMVERLASNRSVQAVRSETHASIANNEFPADSSPTLSHVGTDAPGLLSHRCNLLATGDRVYRPAVCEQPGIDRPHSAASGAPGALPLCR